MLSRSTRSPISYDLVCRTNTLTAANAARVVDWVARAESEAAASKVAPEASGEGERAEVAREGGEAATEGREVRGPQGSGSRRKSSRKLSPAWRS